MEWWQTLAIGLSSSVIGGLIAVGGSYLLERQRWNRDDQVRRQQWQRDDVVQHRDAMRELYTKVFREFEYARQMMLLLETEPRGDVIEETDDASLPAIRHLSGLRATLGGFVDEIASSATSSTVAAYDAVLDAAGTLAWRASTELYVIDGQLTEADREPVRGRDLGRMHAAMREMREAARRDLGHESSPRIDVGQRTPRS